MTDQIDWLSGQHARRENLETSKAAARSVKMQALALIDRILEIIKKQPATQDELAYVLGLQNAQVNKRTADLKNAGVIESSGETRPGKSGRQQTVWRAKQ